jgi:hypothetical protein
MIRTVKYGELDVVNKSIVTRFDTWIDSLMDSEGDWYDVFALVEDGSLVAVKDEVI